MWSLPAQLISGWLHEEVGKASLAPAMTDTPPPPLKDPSSTVNLVSETASSGGRELGTCGAMSHI